MYSRDHLELTGFTKNERQTFAPARQVLVRTHPVPMRKSLFLDSYAGTIMGWPMAEARIYPHDLIEHTTQSRFTYVHHWQSHGPVMWDNRQTMHHVRRFAKTQGLRDIRRTAISGDGPATPQVIQT